MAKKPRQEIVASNEAVMAIGQSNRLATEDDFWPIGPDVGQLLYVGQSADPLAIRQLRREERAKDRDTLPARILVLAEQLATECIEGHPQRLVYELGAELLWADEVLDQNFPELSWHDPELRPTTSHPSSTKGPPYMLTCHYCGTQFHARRKDKKYHSNSCKTLDYNRRKELKLHLEIPGYFHKRVEEHSQVIRDAYRWSDNLEARGMVKAALYLRLAADELIKSDAKIAGDLSGTRNVKEFA